MITIGIDIGARTAKVVLFDAQKGDVAAFRIAAIGSAPIETARSLLEDLSRSFPADPENNPAVITGYGRKHFPLPGRTVTEITCQGRGVHHLFPDAATVIDIGGQDSKVISLGAGGRVEDFLMNDRCAAGTGGFLEIAARILEVPLEKSGAFALSAPRPAEISSMCAVFAESEVIGLLAQGHPKPAILRGVCRAAARRIAGQVNQAGLREPVVFTGGAALNRGLIAELERELRLTLRVPPVPQITAALGAALLAAEKGNPKKEEDHDRP
ncbi:MAG TPA: acyl-CoA dehydratase activase [Planctomycetota bacterium]|jgi:predicted CoA-substrate-specific enzyme activase|nr:2-hydroxyglutaryl-CoA dehydratase [Planctomycetota bacterium]OQC20788.1 MAG: R-phenyllactate dehydratase activator [Planctomycetes bacterium ADurb.Bin069]NMD35455.1 2-hydroxyglutaryl-CoA dehydratase [Planctomycetota bacterium]HNR99348.1 acyl-CoA dehydratase activase [Planctomycetota bacterium]HNU26816.1 acyl-CoA dehydratase activase [Planctomycetota bacterium]